MIPTTPHAGARALRRPIRPGSAPSPPSDPSSPHIPAVHPPTAGIRASRLPKRFAGRHFARQAAEWRGPVALCLRRRTEGCSARSQEEEEKKPARDSPARTHAWIKPRAEPEGFRRGLRRVGRSDLRRGRAPAGSIVAAARGLVRGERCWSSNWAAVLRDSGAVAAAAGTPAGFASRRSVRRGFVEGLAPLHREVVEAAAGGRSVRIGRQEDSGRVHGRLDRGFQLAPPGAMAADSGMGFHQGIAAAASVYNHHHHHHHNMLSFQSSSSDASMGGGGAGMALMSMGGPSSTAGPFLSPNNSSSNNNNGVFGNSPVVGPSRSSSGGASRGGTTASKYKFITGSPSEWSDRELNLLNEGLTRYAREPNIMRYIKIAAMLPNRTIRDVALRCWWAAGKDRRKKPEGFFTGKKMRDMKPMQDKMFASAPMANFHMAPTNSSTPFSISIQNPNQQCQVPTEAISDVMDSATQQLLEENNQLLNQIAANIESFKTGNNAGLFLRTNSNIKTILSRMSETPGIMGRMPPLPEFAHEDKLNSLLQVDRMVQSYSAAHTSHMKEEP